MPEGPVAREREEAIIRLMDDDSPVVQSALIEELKRLGRAGIALLQRVAHSGNRILGSQARDYLNELEGPDTVAEFVRFIQSLNYELETGCILLNRTVFPEAEAAECCMTLDAIAARCRELMILPSSAWERCRVINRVLFHEYGYRGNTEEYEDPRNSFLNQVLQRRKGIPITLCIIYILTAQRCNLQLEPISVEDHFVVGCFQDDVPFYIDAYERGAFRTTEELLDVIRCAALHTNGVVLAPSPVGEVLRLCCVNLIKHYQAQKNSNRAKLFASFVHQFDVSYRRPENP